MPLTMLSSGQSETIKRITGKDETKKFLESLGFVVGGNISVISESGGNLIVNVKDTRVAISKVMANRVMVWIKKGRDELKTLKDTKPGEIVKVIKIDGAGAVKRRIMDMGITKGVEIFVRKVAPLGDPIEIQVRGYELSLRKADSEMIAVE